MKHLKHLLNLLVLLMAINCCFLGCSDRAANASNLSGVFYQTRDEDYNLIINYDESDPLLVEKQISMLKSNDPQTDAMRAFERGDCRLMGIQEFAVFVPGLETHSGFLDELCIKMILGADNSNRSPEVIEIRKLAEIYALKYNREILRQTLKEN